MASDIRPPVVNGRAREKIALQPGFHLADWMRLTSVATNLSGRKEGEPLRKITPSELALHASEFDCWTAYQGKVYNITQYIPYHPGGKPKLMLGAGKDCTELFDRYHRWVNIGSILGKCLVGTLIEEQERIEEGDENEDGDDTTADAKQAVDRLCELKLSSDDKDGSDSKQSDAKADSK
jgi:cytochrome b involved in lipid metabolism